MQRFSPVGVAWYGATRNGLLEETGCVAEEVVRHTLRAGDVPKAVYQNLAEQPRKRWPTPWRDAILDYIGRRAVISAPIAE